MSSLPLELPTIQNWSCHNCGGCCRQHGVQITPAERDRIEQQGWTPEHGIPADQPLFVEMGGWWKKRWTRLAHQPDGACVFLDARGLCRIHARFGEPAKPLACRIYPYAFHPMGARTAVGLRFSCPSVARNVGRPVPQQRQDLRELAELVLPPNISQALAPEVSPGQRLDWGDFLRINAAAEAILADEAAPLLLRILRLLDWLDIIEQSKFDKLSGPRLREFLGIIAEAVAASLSEVPTRVPPPTVIGRTQFRQLAGHYARKDTYASADGTWRGRLRLFRMALRLAQGTGFVPAVQDVFREVPFDALEAPRAAPPEADALLTRYLRVKLRGLSHCGAAYYRVDFVEGLRSLVLVLPAVMWIARWLAASADAPSLSAAHVEQALTIADHHHGYSPAFGTWGFRRRVKNLAKLGDIPRLCVWYSRGP